MSPSFLPRSRERDPSQILPTISLAGMALSLQMNAMVLARLFPRNALPAIACSDHVILSTFSVNLVVLRALIAKASGSPE